MTDYAMFTDFGNVMVADVVKNAKDKNLQWGEVYRILEALSTIKGCEEATDTAVREAVYFAMGYDE